MTEAREKKSEGGEGMSEAVAFLMFHLILYAATVFSACGYMSLFTWIYHNNISGDSFVALVMPSFAALAALVFAFGVGWTASDKAALWILIGDVPTFIGSCAVAWIKAIKNYSDYGYAPQHATFYLVTGYSFAILAGSAALAFFI